MKMTVQKQTFVSLALNRIKLFLSSRTAGGVRNLLWELESLRVIRSAEQWSPIYAEIVKEQRRYTVADTRPFALTLRHSIFIHSVKQISSVLHDLTFLFTSEGTMQFP